MEPKRTSYLIEDIEISVQEFRLSRNGTDKHLRRQAFQVLVYLVEHQHRAIGRTELIESVWRGAAVTDDSVGQCISEIRDALGDDSHAPRFIKTLPKIGYQFIGTIREFPSDINGSEQQEKPLTQIADSTGAGARSLVPTWSRLRGSYWIGVVALVIGAFAAGLIWRHRILHSRVVAKPPAFTVAAKPRRSMTIIGFTNLSGRPEDAWFSTALSDWYSTELAAGEQLRVVSPALLKQLGGKAFLPGPDGLNETDLERIRRVLGVDLVLSGSYAKLNDIANGPIRIDLRIQDTHSGDTIFTTSASGNEARIFDLVSTTGNTLRGALAVPGVTHEQARQVAATLPSDPKTEKLYAEGIDRFRASDFSGARDLLLKAVAQSPEDPMPHAALASAWEELGYDHNAESEAKRALELSSHLSRANRLLLSANYDEAARNWSDAIRTYGALFTFFPDDLNYGLGLANAQVTGGRWTDAIATLDRLHRLPPPARDDPRIDLQECTAQRSLGNMREAVTWCAKSAHEAQASGAFVIEARALLGEAETLSNIDDTDKVVNLAQSAKQLFTLAKDQQGLALSTDFLATNASSRGDYQDAASGYKEALAVYDRIDYQPGIAGIHDDLGDVFLHMGNTSAALAHFEKAFTIYRTIGEQDGTALVDLGIGDVYRLTGQHAKAMATYRESIEICHETGNRSRGADAQVSLGKELWIEGDLPSAYQAVIQAKAIFQQLGENSKTLRLAPELSGILLDENRTAESVKVASDAAEALLRLNEISDQAAANLALTNALLTEDRVIDAEKAFAVVQQLSSLLHDPELIWSIKITAARLEGRSGKIDRIRAAESELQAVATQAAAASFVNISLTAELDRIELEIRGKSTTSVRAQISSLAREASDRGFDLIAQKADAELALLQHDSNTSTPLKTNKMSSE